MLPIEHRLARLVLTFHYFSRMTVLAQHDDKLLFEQIANGYEPAFRSFFEKYKSKVYYFVLNIVKSASDAEELTQDVFFRIWISRKSLSDVDNPSTYMYVTARNRALDHLKKLAADKKMRQQISDVQISQSGPEEELLFKESRDLLEQAIKNLPAQQQKVYRLSKEAGLTREQVAEQLKISPNTVKNHLADAMNSIRKSMQGVDPIVLFILLTPLTI